MGLLPDTQICGCACAGNAGNVFPVTAGKRSRHASRHVRDARAVMHAGIANQRFPLKSAVGENVPGIPGACATCNFTYLVRGPWNVIIRLTHDFNSDLAKRPWNFKHGLYTSHSYTWMYIIIHFDKHNDHHRINRGRCCSRWYLAIISIIFLSKMAKMHRYAHILEEIDVYRSSLWPNCGTHKVFLFYLGDVYWA